jgi:multiple sugar transport system substrate-binding protein
MREMRKINRRDFLRLSAGFGVGTILAACAPATPQVVEKIVERVVTATPKVVQPGEKVSLSLTDFGNPVEQMPMWDQLLPLFHEQHPHIELKVNPTPDRYTEKLTAQFVAGDAPDLFGACCDFLPQTAQRGQSLSLDAYVERDISEEDYQDWNQQVLAVWTVEGNLYALPQYTGTEALYYDVALFDELGVDYPGGEWTHDDYIEVGKAFIHMDDLGKQDRWGVAFQSNHHVAMLQMEVNQWGGHFVNPEDDTHCVLDEAPAQAAFEWLRSAIFDLNVVPSMIQIEHMGGTNLLGADRTAMVEEGSWRIRWMVDHVQKKWDLQVIANGPVQRAALATIDGFSIWKGTKNPDAAWDVMKFVTGLTYGRAYAAFAGRQPAKKSLLPEYASILRHRYPVLEDINLEAFIRPMDEEWAIPQEIFCNQSIAMEEINPVTEQILMLGKAGVEAYAEMAEKLTNRLREECGQ